MINYFRIELRCLQNSYNTLTMPYKHNLDRRHKFKKSKYKVTNWANYNDSLRKRGDITIWFSDDAVTGWHPERIVGKRGRPQKYSESAIECCLMLRQVYGLALRQTEGFTSSLINLMGLEVEAPDYSCISRRSISLGLMRLTDSVEQGSHLIVDSTGLKVYGKDEWHQEKHNVKARRTWRKLHLGIDENHQIIACDLTDKSTGDTTALDSLFDQIEKFNTFLGDGAYDGDPVYKKILAKSPNANIYVPPPKNAVENSSEFEQRNSHTDFIAQHGRMAWQRSTGYGLRAHAELAMLRYKTIIGPKLKAREISQQKTEAQISVRVLNIMTKLGMPISVKAA